MSAYATTSPHLAVLSELGQADRNIVVVSQDMGTAGQFTELFPERHFDVGISEENLIGVAAGLAHAGKTAFVIAMAPFVSMRAFEQIRDDCGYNRNNVKIIARFTGLEAGPWGVTHHAMEDIALMRCIPDMTILVPADNNEIAHAVNAAATTDGPVYIRAAGFATDMSPLDATDREFRVGKAAILRDGSDLTLIATGSMVRTALAVHAMLAADGIGARVVNIHTLKPIDRDVIIQAAQDTGRLLTLEEHSIIGGLGAAVAEIVAELGVGRLLRVGIPDRFCTEVAPYGELMQNCGLDTASVAMAARRLLAPR
jgi:transketolase